MKSEELQDPPDVERGDREYERLVEEDLRELRERERRAKATPKRSEIRHGYGDRGKARSDR